MIIDNLNKTRHTLKEVLKNDWDTSSIVDLSNEELEVMYSSTFMNPDNLNGCNFSLKHNQISNVKLHIIYYNFPEIGNVSTKITKYSFNEIYEYLKHIFDSEDSVFIIINENITETISNNLENLNIKIQSEYKSQKISEFVLQEMQDKNCFLEKKHFRMVHLFNINHLTNNLLNHRLVPLHIPIRNEKDKKKILEKCNCTLNQLPIILKNDPIAKLIRLAIDDICEIKRDSIKSGEYSFYRVCK